MQFNIDIILLTFLCAILYIQVKPYKSFLKLTSRKLLNSIDKNLKADISHEELSFEAVSTVSDNSVISKADAFKLDSNIMQPNLEIKNIQHENEKLSDLFILAFEVFSLKASAIEITKLCDKIDAVSKDSYSFKILKLARSNLLSRLLTKNREDYVNTVTFLSNRIPRSEMPNVQDIPYPNFQSINENSLDGFVPDCSLTNITYSENILDKFLLKVFRGLVQREIGWKSDVAGINGLLEEGKIISNFKYLLFVW